MSIDDSKAELLSQGVALAGDLEHNWPALGQILKRAYRLSNTEAAFQDVCERMSIGTRTGYYILRLTRRLTQLELEPPADVSWRMLVETLPCLRRDNYERILAFCRAHTRESVIKAVKTHALD
ncbi:MAG: hypothetical protein Q8R07_04275 [Candidatus Uhrbacteria bacterium]|nr:hypothetical protein [Candidatus Uhrbacteria bacterium]